MHTTARMHAWTRHTYLIIHRGRTRARGSKAGKAIHALECRSGRVQDVNRNKQRFTAYALKVSIVTRLSTLTATIE